MKIRPVRALQAGSRVLAAHAGRLSRPLKINWCVTYWCQYRCQTCNIWQRRPTDELTTDELLKFVERNSLTEWLDVTGGEIFLRDDIETVLLAVVRTWNRLVLLHYPTNGFLTDRIVAVTERLAAQRRVPIIVTVSLDGDELLNDRIRGIKGGYRRQIETFRRLRHIPGVTAALGMTLSRLNVTQVGTVFEACRRDIPDLNANEFHLNVAQTSSHYYGTAPTEIAAPAADVQAALKQHAGMRRSGWSPTGAVEGRYLKLLGRFIETGVTPLPCHALRSSCFIDPWGTVYPCITFASPVGQLRDHDMDLAPIWTSAKAAALQREIWNGHCPQCWTACEAYQTLLGNLLTPWRLRKASPGPVTGASDTQPVR